MDEQLLEILACPKCKGPLDHDRVASALDCQRCRLRFEIREGIPVLLIEEAHSLA